MLACVIGNIWKHERSYIWKHERSYIWKHERSYMWKHERSYIWKHERSSFRVIMIYFTRRARRKIIMVFRSKSYPSRRCFGVWILSGINFESVLWQEIGYTVTEMGSRVTIEAILVREYLQHHSECEGSITDLHTFRSTIRMIKKYVNAYRYPTHLGTLKFGIQLFVSTIRLLTPQALAVINQSINQKTSSTYMQHRVWPTKDRPTAGRQGMFYVHFKKFH